MKHLAGKDFFIHEDKNIFSSFLQLLADLPFLEYSPTLLLNPPPTQKQQNKTH
jgi:hypothetical protein